jgi:GAF domain-containing protein
LQMNHHARTLLGKGVASDATVETLAQVYNMYRHTAPGHYPNEEMPIVRAMCGEVTTIDDLEIHRPDGSRVLLEMSSAPITDASGSVTAVVATLQDITVRREAESALERQARQLMTVAQVASAASRVAEPEQLAQEAVDLVCQQLGMCYAGLFLIDQTGHWTGEPDRWAVLRAGTGEQGRQMVEQGYTVEIAGDTMVGQCVALGEPRVALDLSEAEPHRSDLSALETRSELALPLISRGETIGAMTFQSSEANAFREQDVTVLQVMADQLASAIQNTRLFAEAQEAVQRVETLYETSRALSASLEEEPVIRAVLQTIDQRMGCEYAIVYTVDEEAQTIEGRHGIWGGEYDDFPHWIQLPRYPLEQAGVLTEVYRRGQTEIRGGWSDRFDREIWGRLGRERLLRIYAPIAIRQRVIGVVEIGYDRQNKSYIGDDEARLLAAFVDQAAVALENARLFQQTHRTLEEMEVLNALSSAVSRSLEPTEVLYEALKQVLTLTGLDAGLVSLVRQRTGELQLAAHQGLPQPFVERLLARGMEGTLCDLVHHTGELLALADLAQGAPTEVGDLIEIGFRSYLGVPLEARGGTLGTLCVFGQSPRTVKESTLSLMRALGQQVGIAVENARLFEDAQRRAERERVIREVSRQMQQATDVQSLMRITAEELNHLLGSSRVYLRMGTQADLIAD